MPFQCAEVIFGMVFLPASVSLRHSYSSQPERELAHRQQVLRQREVAVGMVVLLAERTQQAGDGAFAVVHVDEDQRQVHQVVGVGRIQPDQFLARRQRLVHAVGGAAERGEVGIPARVAGPHLDGALEQADAASRGRSARR